jgi:hypothetical protein
MKTPTSFCVVILTALLAVSPVLGADAPAIDVLAPLPSPPPPASQPIPLSRTGATAATPGTPARPALPNDNADAERPSVSVTHTGASPAKSSHSNKTKWIIAAVVAGGAAGAMMAMKGGKGTAAAAPPSLSIGTPTISIGAPH